MEKTAVRLRPAFVAISAAVVLFASVAVGERSTGTDTPGAPNGSNTSGASNAPGASIPAGLAETADAHYAKRAEGHRGGRADASEVGEAIAGYAGAAAGDPEDAATRWKLARALYFLGTYTGQDEKGQREAFARGRDAGEESLAILVRRRSPPGSSRSIRSFTPAVLTALLRDEPDAAPALFWSAVDWGQWGLATSKVDAARQGVAHRVRDYCLALIGLDPAFEEGGAYRILGRLHDRAPRIPFVTGWVSREEGLRYLRLAAAAAPGNLVNLQFLAEALARAGDREESRRLEERILAATPAPGHLVEELAIQDAARAALAAGTAAGSEGRTAGGGRRGD